MSQSPIWLIILSDQLFVVGLVSRYLTNYLIKRNPPPHATGAFDDPPFSGPCYAVLATISRGCPPTPGQVGYALLSRLPLTSVIRSNPFSRPVPPLGPTNRASGLLPGSIRELHGEVRSTCMHKARRQRSP